MSEKPLAVEPYTDAENWADDVHAIVSGLALHKPILVGWSYGGFIINDYLTKYGQDAIGGIHYVSAGVLLGVDKVKGMYGGGFMDHVPGMCSENLADNIRAVRQFLHAVFEKQPSQDDYEVMLASNMCVPPVVRLGLVSRAIDRDDILQTIRVPVLAKVQHAESSRYAGIGHAPHFEDPVRFNRELSAFARQSAYT